MRPFGLLAVAAVLLTGVVGMPAVSETQAFAANPQAQVSVDDSLWTSIQGDSYTASPATLWERGFDLRYYVQSGTVTGPSAQITLPNGLSDVWSWSGPGSSTPIYINWTGATNTLKGTWPSVPAYGTSLEVGAVPPYSVGAPPVSVSRSISNPVLTGNSQTRTVTLDVTVNSSLAAFNWFNANLIPSWGDMPQGMAYAVGAPTLPADFSAGPDPGSYYCSNPSALGVGTYHFEADVQFNRTGVLAQATAGDLYYKPASGVNYGVYANVTPTSGTSIALTAASGVVATFSSQTPTDFTGNTMVGNSLELRTVATGVGPATPSNIWVVRVKGTSISGTTLHGVHVEVKGANITEGTITSPGPGGAVYGMRYNYDSTDNSWYFGFDFNSATESDLAGFTAGTYQIALKGSDGVTRNYTAIVPDKAMPTEMPQFTQAMGFDTTDKRPTIGWLQATDQNISKNYVQMELMTDESGGYEYNGMVDKAVISLTPTEDLGLGAWYAMVAYFDHTETVTGGDAAVPLQIDFGTYTDAYFNVTPEPATLALLAAGACALRVLRRRR
jgi:hypothetical protein